MAEKLLASQEAIRYMELVSWYCSNDLTIRCVWLHSVCVYVQRLGEVL
jgi:hypothetical protein